GAILNPPPPNPPPGRGGEGKSKMLHWVEAPFDQPPRLAPPPPRRHARNAVAPRHRDDQTTHRLIARRPRRALRRAVIAPARSGVRPGGRNHRPLPPGADFRSRIPARIPDRSPRRNR